VLAIEQCPRPFVNGATQLANPATTVTSSPLGTDSPLWAVTFTLNTATDSLPNVTNEGATVTLVLVKSLKTLKLLAGLDVEAR